MIERRCKNEMSYKKQLIYRIFSLLDVIENQTNQPVINQIRGLLYNLLDF